MPVSVKCFLCQVLGTGRQAPGQALGWELGSEPHSAGDGDKAAGPAFDGGTVCPGTWSLLAVPYSGLLPGALCAAVAWPAVLRVPGGRSCAP